MSSNAYDFTPAEIRQYYQARVPRLKQSGQEWRGPCPVHGGEHDSFAVNAATGAAYCHSKCGRGWKLVDLERELNGGTAQEAFDRVRELIGRPRPTSRRRLSATYDYTDEAGNLLFQVCRYEPKGFKQRRPDGGTWRWNIKGVRRVLYRLPKLASADRVLIVEGEKDVHTLEQWGYTATCNPGGAGKWREEYSEHLAGKDVVILPDNDEAGRHHAEKVRQSVADVAASVRILNLPGLPDNGDVTDWASAGGKSEQFEKLLEQTMPVSSEPALAPSSPSLRQFRIDEQGIHARESNGEMWIGSPLAVEAVTRDFDGLRR